MNELEEFKLPEPDTRLVVFGKTVFKIKYKTCGSIPPKDEGYFKTRWFYDELNKITKAVLANVTKNGRLAPLRSDHLVVYPGFHLWESAGDLQFSQDGEELHVHPNVIMLLVKLLAPAEDSTVTKLAQGHTFGKRRLPPDSEHIPPHNIPSSYHLTRKKIRLEGEPPVIHTGVCRAALPTGTCTPVSNSFVKAKTVPTEMVAHCTSETMQSLHNLSQPIQLKDNETQKWFNPLKIIKYVLHPLVGALQSKS